MEIPTIKSRLSILEILHRYGLKPDKNQRLNCPFHKDKTPSMQVYAKTNTVFCFSSNCKTHGKAIDVIDFIMHKENCTKHEAIEKAKSMLSVNQIPTMQLVGKAIKQAGDMAIIPDNAHSAILGKAFSYFLSSAKGKSMDAKAYIKQRGLDINRLEIGYNSGQLHHRENRAHIEEYEKVHLLKNTGTKGITNNCYSVWAKHCIIFALRNRVGQISGLYGRSIITGSEIDSETGHTALEAPAKNAKHFYLKNRSGLYPRYPKAETEKLILTEAVIDAATLLQIPEITSHYELISCYGTNGLTQEHTAAIRELKQLKEIIFAFDNDEAGNKATEKYSIELHTLLPQVSISKIELPCKDVNETLIAHQSDVFTHLINERLFLFSIENTSDENKKDSEQNKKPINDNSLLSTLESEPPATEEAKASPDAVLNTSNPYKLRYATDTATYYIQGGISKMLDNMKLTLVIEPACPSDSSLQTRQKARNKIDLYEDKQVEKLCKDVSEKLNLRKDLIEGDIYKLTDLLDTYRETQMRSTNEETQDSAQEPYPLTAQERQQVEKFLKEPQLIYKLNELLGASGIAGEETNRIFLLIIAISYKMTEPLHALIQGSSGSGKTRLLRQISDCIPPERVIRLTRVSDKGFYNYPEKYLKNKLVSLEDVDGLGEEATFAFRELQSNGELNSATSIKLENGHIVSGQRRVKGPIASLACTTQGEIYEDNMSRVFLIAVDESREQTQRIIRYQNNKAAGQIDSRKEQDIKRFIQNLVREITPGDVLNPYANHIQLPEEAYKIRRLNDLFQSFIKMITVINRCQRKKDDRGRLLTQVSDIETAIDIMFESIVLKVDELDGSLRQFYEKLKKYVSKKSRSYEFSRFEVREATGLGKTQQHHYMNKLLELEYLQQYGFANRGFKYKIVYWDDYSRLREQIKQHLQKQLQALAFTPDRTPNRTPEVALTEAKT